MTFRNSFNDLVTGSTFPQDSFPVHTISGITFSGSSNNLCSCFRILFCASADACLVPRIRILWPFFWPGNSTFAGPAMRIDTPRRSPPPLMATVPRTAVNAIFPMHLFPFQAIHQL